MALPTRADNLYQQIRSDILKGHLCPGQRLKFPELRTRYNTSVGAAREVLTRLVGAGFVESQSRHGYTVTSLSYDDLADLTQARIEIESLVLRHSITEGDLEWESEAVAAHHRLARAPLVRSDDPGIPSDEWTDAHAQFHLALLAGCSNRRLLATAKSLREGAELYRQWSFSQEPDRDVAAEHNALLDAAIAHDADRGSELIRDHIAHTATLLLSHADDPTTDVSTPYAP